jgi:hypothetical protein
MAPNIQSIISSANSGKRGGTEAQREDEINIYTIPLEIPFQVPWK